jgi:predicted PhzF superfamily epimerase YddE/YHI9
MAEFARWTNLSETTFVLPPSDPTADYRVRILTPSGELPFAGHPTLGTCHAWLEAGGRPRAEDIVQECAAGLVPIRPFVHGLAFASPPLIRSGRADEALVERIAAVLRLDRSAIVAAEWVDNGPGWVAALLPSADDVLALPLPDIDLDLGVVGPYPPGSACAFEVRAFFRVGATTIEDPVTGSLNAGLADWLVRSGRATLPYVAAQGTAMGRQGRVHAFEADGRTWIGGRTVTRVEGRAELA